ncbi:MAG TPA: hypothetical protein VK137_14080, partial [Planctomycetaceae bacterium]|nr:hypothetical protein [Planctomycetaceae bacterium]
MIPAARTTHVRRSLTSLSASASFSCADFGFLILDWECGRRFNRKSKIKNRQSKILAVTVRGEPAG